MLAREARGEVQWQRAVANTIAILRKAGVSQEEAAKAVTLIQSSYRGYYIRRNIRLKLANEEPERPREGVLEPRETIQAVAWMDMMYQDSKHTIERANEAATTIQAAFRGFRARNNMHTDGKARREESSKSMVVEAILENIRGQIWDRVKSSENFPEEYGSREEMEQAADEIQIQYKNKQRNIRISEQLTEDSDEDRVESAVEKIEAVDAEDFIQEVEANEEFEVVAEPISEEKEDLAVTDVLEADAQMTVAQVVVESEPHEHSDDQEESVAVDEPEIKPVTILEPAVEAPVGIEHHEAHEKNELATEVEQDGNEKAVE
ncbi:uncharacterized protein LOC112694783 [Athalia rosae]|uniref:uncharacterized protein LOC112694783 n=1 Tax=Athalia rosae TaxID=37344 RepID=UPI002033D8A3|nr:uncharacterized protein LOC112694783 [Athalia rosae]